jgi:hypothetical protein
MQRLALGPLADVALAIKRVTEGGPHGHILVFNADTSALLEVDTRGTDADVLQRYATASEPEPESEPANALPAPEPLRSRGRPKLGVVAREVTLLPRHWDWLNSQPGGASVALRKLVDEARRTHAGRDAVRRSRDATYQFMTAIASGLDSFEEATRALFAGDSQRFQSLLTTWPADVREHAQHLARQAFDAA